MKQPLLIETASQVVAMACLRMTTATLIDETGGPFTASALTVAKSGPISIPTRGNVTDFRIKTIENSSSHFRGAAPIAVRLRM